jgi:tetratricopeptide (TPR) repeat protein
VAKNGRAEVLKALGRLDEALQAYDAVIAEYPGNAVAKSGRAEVLKALGRLEESLQAYDAVIAKHPEHVVAKNGHAEVLKALGRLDEALQTYDAVIAEHPWDVVAKNGRAEVLKALGRLDEALQAYDAVIVERPEDVVAKNGRACVLAVLNRLEEALVGLPTENPRTEGEWIGYHIRGTILMKKGDIEAAIRIFEDGLRNNPWPTSRDYFRTALAVARLRQRDYAGARDLLVSEKTQAPTILENVLEVHVFGALGNCERAVEAYKRLPVKPGPVLVEIQEEVHRRYVAYEAPAHDEDWLVDKEIDYFLVAA